MHLSRRIISAGTLALMAALGGPAHAQSSDSARIAELEKKLERSLQRIEQLSSKISQIEQGSAQIRESESKPAQQTAKIESIEKQVSEIGGGLSGPSTDEGLPVHGFADVGLSKRGKNNSLARGRSGAVLGNFDLYLTPQLGDRVRALVELTVEPNAEGASTTDLERMQIGYAFSDAATAWLGRFHTPYGYWNTAFHHGAQIQTSISRPRFLDFEDRGGILPAHSVGGWLSGALRANSGRIGYDAYLANAPQINGTASASALAAANPLGFSAVANAGSYAGSGTLDIRQAGSASHRSSLGGNAWYEPDEIAGLRLGLHGLRAEVIDDSANANKTLLQMSGGYFAYLGDPWEALGEYYKFRNQDRSGATGIHGSWAGYAHLGYNIGSWTPYGRTERTKLDQTDNYFGVQTNGRSYRRLATGLRYDVDPKAALKIELQSTRIEDHSPGLSDRYSALRVQYAIRF